MTRMVVVLPIAAVLLSAGGPRFGDEAATPVKTARKAAQEDARTPEGRDWEHRHASWVGPALTAIMKQCVAQSLEGRSKDFAVYVRLSKQGRAREAVGEPTNPFTTSFTNGVKDLEYPNVPREDYWLEIKMNMRK